MIQNMLRKQVRRSRTNYVEYDISFKGIIKNNGKNHEQIVNKAIIEIIDCLSSVDGLSKQYDEFKNNSEISINLQYRGDE